jgi:hypothetical protein
MPKRISKKLKDPNQIAAAVVALSTAEMPDKATLSKIMAEMGRKGGKIGGKRRMKTMTEAQRKAAASKAARARWGAPKG